MSEQQTALQKRPVETGQNGIILSDLDSMWRWANYVAASGLAPKGIDKPESIVVAIQMGLEVGLSPMAALQNIAVINGRPTIWGDAQLGIVRATGELESFAEYYEIAGEKTNRNPAAMTDDVTAVCVVKRRGFSAMESAFSVADAKRAGLWGKAGPWTQYPARMLRYRARGFALRDNFGDALRGLLSTEEARDHDVIDITPKTETAGPTFREKKTKKSEQVEIAQTPTSNDPLAPSLKPESADVAPSQVPEQVAEPVQAPTVATVPNEPTDDSPFALAPEQQLLSEYVSQVCKADFDTWKRGMLKQVLLKTDESWEGFHDVPIAICMKCMGAKKWLNGIVDGGR